MYPKETHWRTYTSTTPWVCWVERKLAQLFTLKYNCFDHMNREKFDESKTSMKKNTEVLLVGHVPHLLVLYNECVLYHRIHARWPFKARNIGSSKRFYWNLLKEVMKWNWFEVHWTKRLTMELEVHMDGVKKANSQGLYSEVVLWGNDYCQLGSPPRRKTGDCLLLQHKLGKKKTRLSWNFRMNTPT